MQIGQHARQPQEQDKLPDKLKKTPPTQPKKPEKPPNKPSKTKTPTSSASCFWV
jgi:hypothetical protein